LSTLKLIKKEAKKEKGSDFRNSCPLSKEHHPFQPCPEGIPVKEGEKIVEYPKCPWWIDSPKSNYCFWNYVRDNSNPDGSMKELAQSDLIRLLGLGNIKTQTLLKEIDAQLAEAFKKHNLEGELIDIIENFTSNHNNLQKPLESDSVY